MEIKIDVKKMEVPEKSNIIVGQAHFIKTVEDIHEALVQSAPRIKFGIAFNESSGPCLVRTSGNDKELIKIATKNALKIGAGHVFVILIKEAFPINVLNAVKGISEVCNIYAATANALQIVVAETGQGAGILGVIDGGKIRGVESEKDKKGRKRLLRELGYKL